MDTSGFMGTNPENGGLRTRSLLFCIRMMQTDRSQQTLLDHKSAVGFHRRLICSSRATETVSVLGGGFKNRWQTIRSHMFENTSLRDPDMFCRGHAQTQRARRCRQLAAAAVAKTVLR
jgi:hypothetical protein